MATDRFKAHGSVRGWISDRLSGGGISADCSSGGGISVDRSGDPSSMTRELEMKLILIVCPFIQGGKEKRSRGEKEEGRSVIRVIY